MEPLHKECIGTLGNYPLLRGHLGGQRIRYRTIELDIVSVLAYIQRLSACVLYQWFLYKAQVLPGSSHQGIMIGSVVTSLLLLLGIPR